MGKKQKYLENLCFSNYRQGTFKRPELATIHNSPFYDQIAETYYDLGGLLKEIPTRTGPYDIQLEKWIIELDEENRFNRYRLLTLNSNIYKSSKNIEVELYKSYCKQYEHKCCTLGGYWHSPSSNKQFGVSDPNGLLNKLGASRWKQRAFYDLIKDTFSIIVKIPIIRISIYETYKQQTIESLLETQNDNILSEFIDSRIKKATNDK